MEIQDAVTTLTSNGWKSLDPSGLPSNDLNTGTSEYLVFADRLSLRFYSSENILRLFIYGKASQPDFQIDFISQIDPSLDKIGHNDVRGLQMEFDNEGLDELVPAIQELQSTITIDSYFDAYFSLQAYASVSILAVEQFL